MTLSQRWPLPDAPALRDRLLEAYGGPDRGYHDLRHLAEVLDRLDELAAAGTPFDRLVVTLAAWFHDAVYDGRSGAEERSAVLAEQELTDLPAEQVAEVARLVRMTEHHHPAPEDPNGCALSDADLAILAAEPDRYAEYLHDVRREYATLTDEQFRHGRNAILRDLAAKDALFHTTHARSHWEHRARVNLERELSGGTEPR